MLDTLSTMTNAQLVALFNAHTTGKPVRRFESVVVGRQRVAEALAAFVPPAPPAPVVVEVPAPAPAPVPSIVKPANAIRAAKPRPVLAIVPTVPAPVAAPAKPKTRPAAGPVGVLDLKGRNLQLLHLMLRPEGANHAEGCAETGWGICSGNMCRVVRAAVEYGGMRFRKWKPEGGATRYALEA